MDLQLVVTCDYTTMDNVRKRKDIEKGKKYLKERPDKAREYYLRWYEKKKQENLQNLQKNNDPND